MHRCTICSWPEAGMRWQLHKYQLLKLLGYKCFQLLVHWAYFSKICVDTNRLIKIKVAEGVTQKVVLQLLLLIHYKTEK